MKAAKSQAKTTTPKVITVVFYDPKDNKQFCRVDFPEALYSACIRTAKKLKISLDRFFELVIEFELNRDSGGKFQLDHAKKMQGGVQ